MHIDLKRAIRISGGNKEIANELVTMFINDLPNMLGRVNDAYNMNNLDLLEEEVHKLFGAASYAAAPRIEEAAKYLEKATFRKRTENIDKYIAVLNEQVNLLLENKDNPYIE